MRAGLLAGFEAGASQAGHIGNGREPDTALLVRRQGPVRGTSSNAHRQGRVSAAGSVNRPWPGRSGTGKMRRVEMWRGGCRSNISVAAPFVWRCLTGSAVAPFPYPGHRTGLADLSHPALG